VTVYYGSTTSISRFSTSVKLVPRWSLTSARFLPFSLPTFSVRFDKFRPDALMSLVGNNDEKLGSSHERQCYFFFSKIENQKLKEERVEDREFATCSRRDRYSVIHC
jgi:hypothetical protein